MMTQAQQLQIQQTSLGAETYRRNKEQLQQNQIQTVANFVGVGLQQQNAPHDLVNRVNGNPRPPAPEPASTIIARPTRPDPTPLVAEKPSYAPQLNTLVTPLPLAPDRIPIQQQPILIPIKPLPTPASTPQSFGPQLNTLVTPQPLALDPPIQQQPIRVPIKPQPIPQAQQQVGGTFFEQSIRETMAATQQSFQQVVEQKEGQLQAAMAASTDEIKRLR